MHSDLESEVTADIIQIIWDEMTDLQCEQCDHDEFKLQLKIETDTDKAEMVATCAKCGREVVFGEEG